jgi:hypothetical protein
MGVGVFGAGPVMGALLVGGALSAAARASRGVAESYERGRRASRETAMRSDKIERIGRFRDQVNADMRAETSRNVEVSGRMEQELERSRESSQALLRDADPEKYAQFLEEIQRSREAANGAIVAMQDDFTSRYHERIAKSMETLGREISDRREAYLSELNDLRDAGERRTERAREIAGIYLDEARDLVASLRDEFSGADFSGAGQSSLVSQLEAAADQFGKGRYEACIAVAKDVSVSAVEEIYRADCKKQEWENYHKLALTLAAEVGEYLKRQETITEETRREIEAETGKSLSDEIVGVRIGDYTERMESGETRFDHLAGIARARMAELEAAAPRSVSAGRLREIAAELNENIYPAAMTAIYRGIMNVNNAFARQNLSEEIISFFEEHNFTFSGYGYENDRHDDALRIGLENGVTGEEIIVTLAPEVMSSGEVQTRVSIDQLAGDERNEERKAYYRESVREVAANSVPGASVTLECQRETRNKLSTRTDLREKLKR